MQLRNRCIQKIEITRQRPHDMVLLSRTTCVVSADLLTYGGVGISGIAAPSVTEFFSDCNKKGKANQCFRIARSSEAAPFPISLAALISLRHPAGVQSRC